MATYTDNYNLIKPDEADYFSVEDINENMDVIDTQLAQYEGIGEKVDTVANKIGEPTESGQTIFSLLANNSGEGVKVIKSIQHVNYIYGTTNTTVAINAVDTTRCIVLFERLQDTTNSGVACIEYTLNSTNLVISHGDGSYSAKIRAGFWIIEFY